MPILTAEERIGTSLAGKYRLDRILGRGGFGVVYAGIHELTGREIATKVLKHELCEQPAFVKRFLQEARAAAMLNHPNVVDVLDLGQEEDKTVFIVLELLNGRDLSSVIEKAAPLPVEDTLAYLLPIMDALSLAHDKGIIHRDLKPDNIFLSTNAKGEVVPKLLDFGIAKMADSGQTATGMVIGTPHYMSPEQARGLKDIGPGADVWSMGVVMWQCLVASVPFDAGTPTGVLAEILTKRAPALRSVAPTLPPNIAAAIDGALHYEAETRFNHMSQFIQAIRNAGLTPSIVRADALAAVSQPPPDPAAANMTPPTVNLHYTPEPRHATGPLSPYNPTPHPGTPPTQTPYGQPAEAKSSMGLIVGAAALAALLLVGGGVLASVVLWPSEDPAPPPVSNPSSLTETGATEPDTAVGPGTVEPTVEPGTTESGASEPAAAETDSAEAPAPIAQGVDLPPIDLGEAAEAPPETPDEPVAATPVARTTRRTRPRPRPRPRPLANPTPRPLPPVSRPVQRAPRVGNQGAPILR